MVRRFPGEDGIARSVFRNGLVSFFPLLLHAAVLVTFSLWLVTDGDGKALIWQAYHPIKKVGKGV